MTQDNSELSRALCMEASRPQLLPQIIKDYIANGADINYQLEEDGFTPLMLAVDRNDELLVTYLLQQGANPLIKNKHDEIASDITLLYSPIHQLLINYELLMATALNDLENAKRALKTGADVNFQGREGYTALLIAAEQGSLELVELLVLHGADSFIHRDDGMGVFFLATGDLIYETIDNGKPFTEAEKQELLHQVDQDYSRWERWRSKSLAARNGYPFDLSHLQFTDCKPTPSNAQIYELEQHFGHPIPIKLKEIFTKYNGGRPELDHFGSDGDSTIGYFYTLDVNKEAPGNIWWVINAYSDYLGSETLPFAEAYNSDIYFLKWVDGKAQVWIWGFEETDYDYDEYVEEYGVQEPSSSCCIFDSIDGLLEALYAAKD